MTFRLRGILSSTVVLLIGVVNVVQGDASGLAPSSKRRFYIQNDEFMKDGQPINIRAGSLHYFRVPPAYWRDRMQRMKSLGLNTITAYVAWNFHEEVEGQVHDVHMVRDFLKQANEEHMMVILRPGPYICGEWEFGGLPSYLLAKEGMKLRTYNAPYLHSVNRWLHKLYASISSMAYSKGGPIIAVQVENEYGSFGDCEKNPDDAKYMKHLYELALSYFGPHILYTTIDGGEDNASHTLQRGSPWPNNASVFAAIDGMLSTKYSEKFAGQKSFNAPGHSPKMWCELWVGWFTVWGDAHAANKSAGIKPSNGEANGEVSFRDGVGAMVEEGASFSLYMAHGGTNFGYWSGANGDQTSNGPNSFKPDITSYDYSSPISEAGDHNIGADGGDLFRAVQLAISSKYGEPPKEPDPIAKEAYGTISLKESASLFGNVKKLQTCKRIADSNGSFPTFEDLGLPSGFVLYSKTAHSSFSRFALQFDSHVVHDRAQIFVDGSSIGTVYRREGNASISAPAGKTMDFLVENMGRINYGQGMYDHKGLIMKPPIEGTWNVYCLPLGSAAVQALPFSSEGLWTKTRGQPVFRRGHLQVAGAPKDTFLDTGGLTKGLIWVNGHNIGRFWATQGPQYTLYVPAPYLKTGHNEVIVLDLEGSTTSTLVSVAAPRYHSSSSSSLEKNLSSTIFM